MISPECIDFSALPSLPIEQRKNLPNTSGVYFVIDSSGNVLYIGRSSNFQQRWIKHHKSDELQKLTNISLTWIEVSETSSLPEIEAALIEWFNPPLNCYPVYSPRQLPELSGFIKWRLNAVMADREVDNN